MSRAMCYFGCTDGMLHRFPKWQYYPEQHKRFHMWKSVLDKATQEMGDEHIYNNVRLCHEHFDKCHQLPKHRLTRNAVPVLNLIKKDPPEKKKVRKKRVSKKAEISKIEEVTKIEEINKLENVCEIEDVCEKDNLTEAEEEIDDQVDEDSIVKHDNYFVIIDPKNYEEPEENFTEYVPETRCCNASLSDHDSQECNDFASFGKDIAQKLRTLPPSVALESQVMLLNILRKQRMKVTNVYEDNNLQKTICDSCNDTLTNVLNFDKICVKSRDTLLDCKKIINTEHYVSESLPQFGACDDDQTNITSTDVVKGELSYDNTNQKISEELMISMPEHLGVKSVSKIDLFKPRRPKIYRCKLCKKVFSFPERYAEHKLEHKAEKVPMWCTMCDKSFTSWSGLRRHKETEHTRPSPEELTCRACGNTYKNKYTLRMHEKIHTESRLCICYICGKKLVSPAVLKVHLETHKENRERKHQCQQCGKKFFTMSVLQSHITKRHSDKKFICETCSFPFADKCNLIRHLRLHEGNKMFKCNFCGRSYAASSSLIEHKRTHSGERPFACNYCPKSFTAKKRLDDHHRIHTGEKPHKCDTCYHEFTQRGTLKRHMKIHEKNTLAIALDQLV